MAKEQQPAVVAQTVMLPIGKIETNHGQIDGLPKNPRVLRDEQYKKLKKSIEDNPEMLTLRELLVYPHDGKYVVIGGNMRLRILQDLGEKEVPCKIIAEDTSVDKLRAYTIKDNTSGGEWDWDDLANEWDADELDSWGLETPEGWGEEEQEEEAQEDDFDEAKDDVPTICKRGDIWQLGEHRLMCGDSTDATDVALLMNGDKADLFITDPPYGVSYSEKNAYLNSIAPANRIQVPIKNDTMTEEQTFEFWKKVFKQAHDNTKDVMSYYCFGAQRGDLLLLLLALKESELQPKHGLVWVKNNHVLGRCDYNYKHEPITYGWKPNGTHIFYGGFCTSVLEFAKPQKSELHPTMKPVPLIAQLITNSSKEGDSVLDLFGGSGTTLIAAEQLHRKCYMMELDEHYCDVIIARWEKFTGGKATKITNINQPAE